MENSQEEITDDDGLGAEPVSGDRLHAALGHRLSHINSIPHVPRVNKSIPGYTDADLDRQRLLERLFEYGLQERRISGDGNCQFRAISDQLFGTPDKHKLVRKQIVYQLKTYKELYQEYVPMDYTEYVQKMGRLGEWGDHVTLQAAADYYGMKIWLVTSFKDTSFIEISPKTPKTDEGIFLSFWAEVHYNSLYEKPAAVPEPPRKRHWLL